MLAQIPVLPVAQVAPMALVLVPRLKQPAAALVRPIQGWGKPGGAGGKIKLFARRKRTVKFDQNSEFV